MPAKSTKKIEEKVPLNMDQIMKMMFKVSDRLTVSMVNTFFNTNIPLDAEVIYETNEIHRLNQKDSSVKVLRIDMILTIIGVRYHFEFETVSDTDIILIRMFEYGFVMTINEIKSKITNIKDGIKLSFPRQYIIFVEQDDKVPENELTMKVVLWNNEEVEYKVPLMKYWKETVDSLVEKDLVPLLPLQLSPEYDYH